MTKAECLEMEIEQLKKRAIEYMAHNEFEKALCVVSKCAEQMFRYNQYYKDDVLEEILMKIGEHIIETPTKRFSNNVRKVMFYDGLGYDLRGNAICDTQTIVALGYQLVYVTKLSSKGKQPILENQLKGHNVIYEYVDTSLSYIKHINDLNAIIRKYNPDDAFFYSTPYDVSGVVVFNIYKGIMNRFYIDINDHAFWLGINTFDYILNNRTIGQSIGHLYREIPIEKQLRTTGFLFINEDIEMTPLPFDTNVKKYVFSGGSLYKTLGDENGIYYHMVEHIVSNYDNVNFVYAGYGDDSEFQKLICKYPNKIFLFGERNDYYQILKGSVFFLNTYPFFGATMMRAAAYANKIPLTLIHENDADDNLLFQHNLGIEFNSYEEIIKEIDLLLTDEKYRCKKETKLRKSYATKTEFCSLYSNIIEKHSSLYKNEIEKVNTEKFRKEYIVRINQSKDIAILGAGIFQVPLIEKAKEIGLTTHVFSWNEKDVGASTADYFYNISTKDKEAIYKKCVEIGIDGICSIASDIAMPSVNYVAYKMGLCGNSLESTAKSTNKKLMRMAFDEAGDPIPWYISVLENSKIDSASIRYPVIVKPTDRSGSIGVTKVNDERDLAKAIKYAIRLSFEKKVMIEEFIEGDEFSVECLSINGNHKLLAVTRKLTTNEPHFIETSHLLPADLPAQTIEKIKSITHHALDTLEIKWGASHTEIKINKNKEIKIIEIGARMGGDCIGSDLVYYGTGVDYMKCVLDIALGKKPNLNVLRESFPVKSVFLFNVDDFNELEEIKKSHPDKLIRIVDYHPENIGFTTDSSNRCGCYIVKA